MRRMQKNKCPNDRAIRPARQLNRLLGRAQTRESVSAIVPQTTREQVSRQGPGLPANHAEAEVFK